MRAALADLPGARGDPTHGRMLVRVRPEAVDDAAARLERVFGLVSFSVAREVAADADLEAIGDAAVDEAQAAIARARPASLQDRGAPLRQALPAHSMEIAQADRRARPGRDRPRRRRAHARAPIGVEVATGRAFVYAGTRAAPGGLPVGASGRALLLLSGGIDSPVAGWLAAKRGLALDAVYFHSPPYVGEKSRDKVLTLARTARALAGAALGHRRRRSPTRRSACATPAPPSWRSCSTAA